MLGGSMTKKYRFSIFGCSLLLMIGVILTGSGGVFASPPPSSTSPEVVLFSNGVQVDWTIAPPNVITNPDGTVRLEIPGFSNLDKEGAPRLPVAYRLVALPPGSSSQAPVTLIVEQSQERTIASPGSLELAYSRAGVAYEAAGNPVTVAIPIDASSPVAGESNHAPVEFEYLGVMRGVSLGRIVFYPVRLAGDQLRTITHIKFRLEFNSPADDVREPLLHQDFLLDRIQASVINPGQVQVEFPTTPSHPQDLSASSQAAIIPVRQRGITQISLTALNNAGFPVGSVNLNNLQLLHVGVPVAMEWDATNQRFLFYADPLPSRWIDYDTYLLYEGTTPGLRMNSQAGNPGILPTGNASFEKLIEQNLLYEPSDMIAGKVEIGRDGDRYGWYRLSWTNGGSPATFSPPAFSLSSVDTTKPASLTIWMIGYTDPIQNPDHRLNIYLNGINLGSLDWDGKKAKEGTFAVPAGVLVNGNNSLSLSVNGGLAGVTVDGMWLDAYSIKYPQISGSGLGTTSLIFTGSMTQQKYSVSLSSVSGTVRAYDVTSALAPLTLTGFSNSGALVTLGDPPDGLAHQYAVTSEAGMLSPSPSIYLRRSLTSAPSAGNTYLIISHSSFINTTPLNQLINLRAARYSVLVQDVQAVYDNFSDGRVDPKAIRSYLASLYTDPLTRPKFVLLVGDGTANPRFYTSSNLQPVNNTYIPPFLESVDPWLGETASDNQFVTLQGNDNLPEIAIGRLPVNSTSELTNIVNKIITYENTSASASWWKSITLVADDPEPLNDFTSDANQVASVVPAGFSVGKIYQTSPGSPFNNTDVINAWNSGNHFMIYVGHGAPGYWAKSSDQLFRKADIPPIQNGKPTPIMLSLTCSTGKFQEDNGISLDETMLTSPTEGAVATWSPTGLGLSSGHVYLAKGFLNSAFYQNPTSIGEAAFAGMLNLMNNYFSTELINSFGILGDPALSLRVNVSQQIFLPFIKR
jgi:hypothetical protein